MTPADLGPATLGELWHLRQQFAFMRENVEPELVAVDTEGRPELAQAWSDLAVREVRVTQALDLRREGVAQQLKSGALTPSAFRNLWQDLGFDEASDHPSSAADDYLEGLLDVPRLTVGEDRPAFGQVNMASRARRIAEFLSVVEPDAQDVVYDLGSGNGKFAVTVAASCAASVTGVELGASYVEAAQRTAAMLGVTNATFVCADVREVDLSRGTVFYLFHPFWGEVALTVAAALAALAGARDITVYAQGPELGYGEHFLAQAKDGPLRLQERRGEYSEILVLRSR